jgi:TolB-like protein/Tfp pilus assembly protein PilF
LNANEGSGPGVEPGAMSALLAELAAAPGEAAGWEPRLRPGATVGRFELVREIGRGAFGVVYEARDTELGRAVAFKAVAAGPRAALREERLLREAEVAARLTHPNIVTLFDVGRSEAGPYLVLELLRGQTLAQRLELGPMSVGEALRTAAAIASGLAHAHASGVVHRDLTPRNVFLCQDGQVKLLDLGMAVAFGRRKLDGGTGPYMAPEQRRGAPEDERTDVFALGVILHRMLSNELPFPAGRAERASATGLQVDEVPALGPFLARMLSVDPVERPRDGDEVARALEAFRQELARSAKADSPAVKVRPRGLGAALAAVARRLGRRAPGPVAEPVPTAGRAPAPTLPAPPPSSPQPSVAVLAFADLSPGKDQDWLCDGLAEEILHALAGLAGLRVAGRSASFQFKGRTVDGREIARALGVTTLLEGGVRRSGDRVRITARLVDADGYEIWSESFDRVLEDVFAIQDEIARAVTSALEVRLSSGETRRLQRTGTRNPRAYELFLRARQLYIHAGVKDRARSGAARHLLRSAIELDPAFAEAHAALADTDIFLLQWHTVEGDEAAVRAEALAASDRALALEPELADAHVARANLLALDGRSAEADAEFRRALALNPGMVGAWYLYARFLFAAGRLEEAARAFEEAALLDPEHYESLCLLPQVYSSLGDGPRLAVATQRARDAVERCLRVDPGDVRAMYMGGCLLIRAGENKRGLEMLARALEIQPDEFAVLYNCACGYALAGELERALELLDRSVATGRGQRKWMDQDSELDALRTNPRFAEIMSRLPA